MEERIIDDEYGRGIRLKKTKDGFVDVTDELAENGEYEEDGEEIAFEFPVLETDEDDEDLVGLSPEEAIALRKQKEEAELQRQEDYKRACEEGDELLKSGSFKAAELKFEKALALDQIATDASVGYWRAKTLDFTAPDILVEEYAESGNESMEYDLGYEAVQRIKKQYHSTFKTREEELEKEIAPLQEKVESAKAERRTILSARLKKSLAWFLGVTIPTIVLLVLTVVIGLKNFTTREDTFIVPTIVLGCVFVVFFIAFMVVTNKMLNVLRLRRANEKTGATEDGAKLLALQAYGELYAWLADADETESEEISEEIEDIEENEA